MIQLKNLISIRIVEAADGPRGGTGQGGGGGGEGERLCNLLGLRVSIELERLSLLKHTSDRF